MIISAAMKSNTSEYASTMPKTVSSRFSGCMKAKIKLKKTVMRSPMTGAAEASPETMPMIDA